MRGVLIPLSHQENCAGSTHLPESNCVEYKLVRVLRLIIPFVQKCGANLQYASDQLKDDKEVVTAAVTSGDASCIRYASPWLRQQKDLALLAPEAYNPHHDEDDRLRYHWNHSNTPSSRHEFARR